MKSTHTREYKQFLQRLKAARSEAHLAQAEVARRLGRQQSFVAKCESGERRVDVLELVEFARVYGKDLAFFLGREWKQRR